MRAIVRDRYGGPEVLRIAELDDPVPTEGEVLVRVRAASLNTVDLDILRGRPPAARLGYGLRRPKQPVLGADVSGRVEAVGPEVTRFRPGDEVWADLSPGGGGAFATSVCVDGSILRPKPPGMSFDEAATIPHSGLLALQGLRVGGGVQPGEQVLINGAGGCVGPFAVQLAKTDGAQVTAVDHPTKLRMLRELGADRVVDHTREDVTRTGHRYDRILDIAANRSIASYRRCLTPGGVYAMIAPSVVRFFEAVAVGGVLSLVGSRRMGAFPWRPNHPGDLAHLGERVASGELRPRIDRRVTLDEIPEALRFLEEGSARGKLVVVF